jgi:sirohydrochlorin cobaltochelatase
MFTQKPGAALVIAGHGSTQNPDSSAPTHDHAARIRAMGVFDEVVCCFWKEEPNMREVFDMLDSRVVYVVPNFISEGYFCEEVLPRELGLSGPVTRKGDRVILYCNPVGVHANMKRLLLQRAAEIAPGVPPEETSLVIVGHGTGLNENSTKAIQDQVRLISEGGHGFAEVVDAYMEQAPFVADWDKLTTSPNVVVVPFFIADGLHSYQDIPVLLGMVEEIAPALSEGGCFGDNPHNLRGRSIFYSRAIGTEPLLADVILDQVTAFDEKYIHEISDSNQANSAGGIADWLAAQLGEQPLLIGQVWAALLADGKVALCHVEDRHAVTDGAGLESSTNAMEARRLSWHDEAGAFRPLHSAPTLRRGWRLVLNSAEDARQALDFLHPAALGLARAADKGQLHGTPIREYLGRQTGMYKFANGITDEQVRETAAQLCKGGCMRRILWPLEAGGEPVSGGSGGVKGVTGCRRLDLVCVEPCPFLLGEARKLARKNFESRQAPAPAISG